MLSHGVGIQKMLNCDREMTEQISADKKNIFFIKMYANVRLLHSDIAKDSDSDKENVLIIVKTIKASTQSN